MAYSRWRAEVVDRAARDEFAELLRHFGAGLIKWQRFEDQACKIIDRTRDLGVMQVFWDGAFNLYSDVLWSYRLRGRNRLDKAGRRFVATMILFLHTDLPYEWPDEEDWWLQRSGREGCLGWFARMCGCRLPGPPVMSEKLRDSMHIFQAVWPFRRFEDFDGARRHPELLAG